MSGGPPHRAPTPVTARRLHEGVFDFALEVPYRLHVPDAAETAGAAPLLVALHGKWDRPERFEEEAMDCLPAGWALLVPSAPLPRDARPGRGDGPPGASWYLYDGDTPAFRRSLARARQYVVDLVARVLLADPARPATGARLDGSRVAVLGFSQGAYLAGMTAVVRPDRFRAAILVGGRLKVEALEDRMAAARGFPLLALHGASDASVLPAPARASIERAAAAGLKAEFREFPGGHEFTPEMRAAAREWLAAL